jgi:hypothetical protein
MVAEDIYDKLAEMIEREDWLGMPKTPALMKLLSCTCSTRQRRPCWPSM